MLDLTTIILIIATAMLFTLIGRRIYDRVFDRRTIVYFVEIYSYEEDSREEREWFIYSIYKREKDAEISKELVEQQIVESILQSKKTTPILDFKSEPNKKWTLDELKSLVEWNKKQFIANRTLNVRVREYQLL